MTMCGRYYSLRDSLEAAYRAARDVSPEHIDEYPDVIDALRTMSAHLGVCPTCREYLDRVSGHQSRPVDLVGEE